MNSPKPIAFAIISALALAACGSSSSAPTTAASKSNLSSSNAYSIKVNKTAQMVMQGKSATFTITALTKSNKPAVGQPVTFYIGPMVPLSNVPPSKWFSSGTTSAATYISSFSKTTNSSGQATLILKGQPIKTMEMIGLKVGSLSSYVAGKGAIGSMDAWWTTPSTTPEISIGNYVRVTPFMTMANSATNSTTVTVGSATGVIKGARVQFTPKINSQKSSSMSSPTSSSVKMTNSSGTVNYSLTNSSMTAVPVRVVVTQGSSSQRVAGGMNILFKN